MSNTFYTDLALEYCDDVLTGKKPTCIQIKQACQRHLDDLASIETVADYPYTYDIDKAERVCKFAARLPHVSGKWAALKNNRFTVQPWQAFILTSLFGWVNRNGTRRFREALVSVARKNGKSFLASAICLYCLLCDGEPGAQIFAAANNLEQAMTVFRPAKQMVERLADLRNTFDIEANAKSFVIPDGSRFVPLVGVARDGQSAHCCVLDEYHEAKEDSLYLSLTQSMGARQQPLMLVTTTAGVTIEGPCHVMHRECDQMLDGTTSRPELFAFIATLDKDTDWTSTDALIMANPNLGVSVNMDGLLIEHQNAIRNASKQNAFKTKKLNVWCNAATAWMNMSKWADCSDSTLTPDAFIGQPCWMSADLSTKLDVTCILKLFKVGNMFYAFPRFYLPSDRALDPSLGMYARWVSSGHLIATDGAQIDMEQVLDETLADIAKYKPTEFIFDKWRAEMYTQMLGKRVPNDVTLVELPIDTKHLSPAMEELEALVTVKHLHHAANPCFTWMMSNVVNKVDFKGNSFPRKTRNENKIDGPVCLMMALYRAVVATPEPEYVFTKPFFV